MYNSINDYRVKKVVLSGDYVCSDAQSNSFLLCKIHPQLNNSFHKNIVLPSIIFPIEVSVTDQQQFRCFPLKDNQIHILAKLQTFSFQEYEILKIIGKIYMIMRSAKYVQQLRKQIFSVFDLDNIWLENYQPKIIWHPRQPDSSYSDEEFMYRLGLITYFLLTGSHYQSPKDLKQITNDTVQQLIYSLISNKQEQIQISFIEELLDQLLNKRSNNKNYKMRELIIQPNQKKIGSIKLGYANKNKKNINSSFQNTSRSPRQRYRQIYPTGTRSPFRNPLYKQKPDVHQYFENAKRQQQLAQIQEIQRQKQMQYVKKELDHVKKQLQKVKKVQVIQVVKQSKSRIETPASKKQSKISESINFPTPIKITLKQQQFNLPTINNKNSIIDPKKTVDMANQTSMQFNTQNLIRQSQTAYQNRPIRYYSNIGEPYPNQYQKKNLWAALRNKIVPKFNQSQQRSQNIKEPINVQEQVVQATQVIEEKPQQKQLVVEKNNTVSKQQSNKNLKQQSNNNEKIKINDAKSNKQKQKSLKQQNLTPQQKVLETIQQKQIHKEKVMETIQQKQIHKEKVIETIQQKQIHKDNKQQQIQSRKQINNQTKINLQIDSNKQKVTSIKVVSTSQNQSHDKKFDEAGSNESLKAISIDIEQIEKKQRDYIKFINLIGESVANSYKVTKKINIQGLDKLTVCYFLYKRFYYQRKRIEESLSRERNDLYRLTQQPIQQHKFKKWLQTNSYLEQLKLIRKQNAQIQKAAQKMLESVIKRNSDYDPDIKKYSNLETNNLQKDSEIVARYIFEEYELLSDYQKINDEIKLHLAQLIDSLLIITQLNNKDCPRVNLYQKSKLKQSPDIYIANQKKYLPILRKIYGINQDQKE